MAQYIATEEGWIDGVLRAKGEAIEMSERAAEHLLIAGVIAPKPADPAPPPATRTRATSQTPEA